MCIRDRDEWLGHGENLQKWECNAHTASERRVLITKWVEEATERIDNLPYRHADGRTSREDTGVPPLYRHCLFEKTGTAMTADGTGDDKISLEGWRKDSGTHSWMWKTKMVMEGSVDPSSSKTVGTGSEAIAAVV